MKKTFADLHLRLNLQDSANATRTINKAATLGYRLVAVPLSPETREDETVKLQNICYGAKIDLASRVDIRPKTQNELLHQLAQGIASNDAVSVVHTAEAIVASGIDAMKAIDSTNPMFNPL
jgi:hypothetical protein